jgi:hypothetical protein
MDLMNNERYRRFKWYCLSHSILLQRYRQYETQLFNRINIKINLMIFKKNYD